MNKRIISLILSIVMILLIIPPASYSAQAASFESELRSKGFPESYIPSLLALHSKYPKWKFEPLIVGENFSTSVSKERQIGGHAQQRIQQYSGNDGKGYYCACSTCYVNGKYVVREKPNWIAASQKAVEYYLDPRNFLNEKYIFQFESTGYNASHTQAGVENILKGSWLYNTNITYKDASGKDITYKNSSGNTVKYSTAIIEAAKYSNMSAYYLASKIKQEVGGVPQSQAGGASGTNSTYPGIYNLYNIQANTGALDGLKWAATTPDSWVTNDTCRLRQGPSTSTTELAMLPVNTQVTYISTTDVQPDGYRWIKVSVTYQGKSLTGYIRADLLTHNTGTDKYNRPWTNPYLSIYNGAKWIANNFSTQFTGYLQKFNVNPASGSSMHGHEYMTNVQGAADEASHAYAAYKNLNLLSDSMQFVIPVFNNMPTGNLATPKLSAISNVATGVQIEWESVARAEVYAIYRKTGSASWAKIGETLNNKFVDTTATSGTKYSYTVRCITADRKNFSSSFDPTGLSITYIAAPKISSVSVDNTGIVIKWNAVKGAAKYGVFYKTGSGSWSKIADTTSTSYTWTGAKGGTNYSFTVRCISSDGKNYTSGFDNTGKSITYSSVPAISSVANGPYGVQITWNAVAGAKLYRVFYKTGSGAWTKIADTTATTYAWTSPVNNTNYTFTVRCLSSDATVYTSGFDTVGKSIKYIAAPKLSSVATSSTGIQITWGKVTGAELYRVYYKTSSVGWTKIVDTTSTSYNWTGAKGGTNYTFTVRCITSDGKSYTSGFDPTGKTLTFLSTPKLTSVSAENTGTVITWEKVAGAENYRVFRKTGSGTWVGIGNTTATSFTDTTAVKGTTYAYTVRCIAKDGTTYVSGFDSVGKNIKSVAAPKLSSVATSATGIQINWEKVSGAELYRVYYKTSSVGWTKIADTTSTSYNWTGAKGGTNYTFTVRCLTSDGKSYTSGFDTTGKSITFLSTPKLTSVSAENTGTVISWDKVSSAENYRVFRKTGNGSWVGLGNTTSTSFTDTTAVKGTTYAYTVRCITKDGATYVSGFDTVGKSLKSVDAPKLSSVATSSTGIQINWEKVTGAELYRVYYKTSSVGWTKIVDATSTSYNWIGAMGGTNYTFTVRCITSDGKSFASGFDTIGKSITFLSTPKLTSVSAENTGTVISWEAVSGAENYRVFRKTGSGTWVGIGNTTATSFTDTTAVKGTTYAYTVRCITKDGSTYMSGFDNTGMSLKAVANPIISSLSKTSNGIQINWGKVTGAELYRVYYKTDSCNWTKIADTTNTSYTWTECKSGTTYTFTVRCLTSDGKRYASGYDATGKSIAY